MKALDRFDAGQLRALCAAALLSPALRFCPTAGVLEAGSAAWLSMLAALPPLLLYAAFLRRFLSLRREGEGLAELCGRAVGEKAARPLLLAAALWFCFYGGFALRAGAERFITTVYPHSTPAVFVVVLGSLAALAALGPSRTLARTARLILPLLAGALALILLTALLSAEKENLPPVTLRDLPGVLRGGLPAFDVIAGVLVLGAFLAGALPPGAGRARDDALFLAGAALFLALLNAAILGTFGAELTGALTRPFFYLVRNLIFFRSVERVEALAVALWVFPDFLLVSTALFAAQLCLRRAWGFPVAREIGALFSMARGRWLIPLCALAAVLSALWMAPDQKTFLFLSTRLIPALNLGFALLALPGIYLIGKRKRRL